MDGNGSTGRWYHGDGLPELETLIDLARRGKVTVDWLLTGQLPRSSFPPNSPEGRLFVAWDGTNEEGRGHVLAVAEAQRAVNPREKSQSFPVTREAQAR